MAQVPQSPPSNVIEPPTLILSTLNLSAHKKDKLFEMLISQNPPFSCDQDGNYVSTLRLPDHVIESILFPKKASNQVPGTTSPTAAQNGKNATETPAPAKPKQQKRQIPAADLEVIVQSLSRRYPRFSSYFTVYPPKPHAPTWAIKIINEIYVYRYMKELELFEYNSQYEQEDKAELPNFPDFVVEYFAKIYGLQSLLHQHCWDFIYNIELYRRKHLVLETFAKFLSEEYDTDDLQFFLYAKNVVEQELAKRGNASKVKPQVIAVKRATQLAKTVFASQILAQSFTQLVESFMNLKQSSQSGIDINELLMLFLLQYHKTRPDQKNESEEQTNESQSKTDTSINELSEQMSENWYSGKESETDSDTSQEVTGYISEELGTQLSNLLVAQVSIRPGESELILANEMVAGLITTIAAYMDALFQESAQALPAENMAAIRAEAETHLQTMLTSLLLTLQHEPMDILKQKSRDPEHDEVILHREEIFRRLQQLSKHPYTRNDDEAAVESRHSDIAAFCSALVGAPEIRQRIEPLVAYLIQATYRNLNNNVYF